MVLGVRKSYLTREGTKGAKVGKRGTVGEVQAHDTVVWLQQRRIHGKIGGRPRVRLHVHAPLLRVQPKQRQRPRLHPRAPSR